MKVLEYSYKHPDYGRPVVKIQHGFCWPFKKIRSYICLNVKMYYSEWLCLDTGEHVSGYEQDELHQLLNATGCKAQLEAREY